VKSASLFLLTAIALSSAGAVSAAPDRVGPLARDSNEFAYRVGGRTFLLSEQIETGAFDDPAVVAEFRRIGLLPACAIYNRHFLAAQTAYEPQFKSVLVGAIRSQVPPEILLGKDPLGWDTPAISTRKRRIAAEVGRTGATLFASARLQLGSSFLAEAALASAADPATASGIFSDWDLEKRLARKSACMILRVGKPDNLASRKLPFDGFYRRGDLR